MISVPVNFLRARNGRQRLFKENISYEHIYNSRVGDNYPIRGKVRNVFHPEALSTETNQ